MKLKSDGKSNIFIAKILSRSKSAIGKFLKTQQVCGNKEIKRSGRPKSTTKRTDIKIIRLIENNNRLSLRSIQKRLDVNISKSTICRRIHQSGYMSRIPRKIPYVSKVNMKKRIKFYEKHAFHDLNYWKRILWSDETKIEMKYHHGKMHVWRKPGDEFSYACTEPTFKGQTRGIMIWGCMSAYGVGNIITVEGNVNAEMYLNILKRSVKQQGSQLIGTNYIFQHDNAPIHTAKIIKKYLKEVKINVLEWPPQSPDLSPIENLWDHLKTRIAKHKPRNIHELREIIDEEWMKTDSNYCLKLVESMTHRISLLGTSGGGH